MHLFCVLVFAGENHVGSVRIVWLLHGCRLEAMRHFVRIIGDVGVPGARIGTSE